VSAIDTSIFRAYDIRGIAFQGLSERVVQAIGAAFGELVRAAGQDTVIVGRDGRLSGPDLAASLWRGLAQGGCRVVDLGMVPTPVVYFAAHQAGTGTAIALTGSHNPSEYNGLKMMLAGDTLHGELIQRLRVRATERLEEGLPEALPDAPVEAWDIVPGYQSAITEAVLLQRPLRVAIDCGNGIAGRVAPALYRALGCAVSELYTEVDGHFPNHHPNPSVPANLEVLIDRVTQEGLDLGLAFDGDGDRLGVVDARGRIIWPDRQMILYAEDVLARDPGAPILFDIKCSRHLADAIRAAGGEPLMWKTGHSLIKAKMREVNAPLAGEMSGHIFFKERWYGFDDALYTGARLLEILARAPDDSAAVFDRLPNSVNTPELNVDFTTEGAHFDFMRRFVEQTQFPEASLTTLDGLRADFADGWGLVRASNTTPSLVIRFEADDDAALTRIQGAFREAIRRVEPTLELPF